MRKNTQWPSVSTGAYARWRKDFNGAPSTRKLLAKLPPSEAEEIRWILFAAQLVPRQLTCEQVTRTWPQLSTRINMVDYVVSSIAALLKGKIRQVNQATATLLTAASVDLSGEEECGWSAEAVKKRRVRARKHLWVSVWGPRFMVSRRSVELLKARQPATRVEELRG